MSLNYIFYISKKTNSFQNFHKKQFVFTSLFIYSFYVYVPFIFIYIFLLFFSELNAQY
jgi:hypothetical protein